MESASSLRGALVAQLQRTGVLQRDDVAAAMRAVPRHRFLPDVTLEQAYADRAIALKSDREEVVSSISQPSMVALMLELLQARPGDRILEVGTGSGYNAALLSALTGNGGSITTIEIDEDLAHSASRRLAELGLNTVTVLIADGASHVPTGGPYDRIVVTARSDDIASAWWNALADGGRLVLPLRIENVGEYAVGFRREPNDRLRSIGLTPCAFIALRGEAIDTSAGDVFYRRPMVGPHSPVCLRPVAEIVATRRENATPNFLGQADVVVARPVSLFAVTFG